MTTVSNVGARVDFNIAQGSDFLSTLTFTNSDTTPVDLTGCTLAAQVRNMTPPVALVGAFVITVQAPPSAGIATLKFPAAVSNAIAVAATLQNWNQRSPYWWDLELTDTQGNISTPLYGQVFLLPVITQ